MAATSYDVFISHAGEDKDFAIRLRDAIAHAGGQALESRVFVDELSLQSGDHAFAIMEDAVRSRHLTVGVCLLSPDFIAKQWPTQELGWLLENFYARKNTATPLHLIPVFLRTTHTESLDRDYIRKQLAAALGAHASPGHAGKPDTAAIRDTQQLAPAAHGQRLLTGIAVTDTAVEECLSKLKQLMEHSGKRRDQVPKGSDALLEQAVAVDVVRRLQERLAVLPLPSEAQSLDKLVAPIVQRIHETAEANPAAADASVPDPDTTGPAGPQPVAPTILVVHGMGGSGKTTQAMRVFNDGSIRERYNKMCFVAVKRKPDVMKLQALLLHKLCGLEQKLCSEQEGSAALRRHLAGVRALVVLDDVWEQPVLDKLVVDMAPGSVVLVTSRFQLKATSAMRVALLEPDAALSLFCAMARLPLGDARTIKEASQVIERCGRLPLALKTLGSLVHKRFVKNPRRPIAAACEHLLQQLARTGAVMDDDGMLASLRVPYNALQEDLDCAGAQEMFVNIGIFSKENTRRAIIAWHSDVLGRDPEDAEEQLRLLQDLHLIEISPDGGVVSLHDQLAALAKNVCTTFLRDAGPANRMFLHGSQTGEVLDKLDIRVRSSGHSQQLLQLAWDELPEDEEHKRMALDIIRQAPELQILRLDESTAKTLDLRPDADRDCGQLLGRLKLLSLQSCAYLTSLSMEGVNLARLRVLDLSGCCLLTSLDGLDIGQCKSLQTLNLVGCISIKLPDNLGEAWSLKRLLLNSSYIKELPSSTTQLLQLKELRMGCCPDLRELPAGLLKACTKLEILELRATGLSELPRDIQYLQRLKYLIFTDMHHVQQLPEELGLLSSLEVLDICMNSGLQSLPTSFTKLHELRYMDDLETPNIKLTPVQKAFVEGLHRNYCPYRSEIGWLWVERAASTIPLVKVLLNYKDFDQQLIMSMLRVLYLMVNSAENRLAVIRPGGLVPLFEMMLDPSFEAVSSHIWATLSNMGVSNARQVFGAAVEFCLGRPAADGHCCRMNVLMKVHDGMRARTYDWRFYGEDCHKIWPGLLEEMEAKTRVDNSPAGHGVAICDECRQALEPLRF